MSPHAPPSPCRFPGCHRKSIGRFCEEHTTDAAREDLARRGSSSSRGYGAKHQKWRLEVLAKDPICRGWPRGDRRHLVPATEADHIVPIRISSRERARQLVLERIGRVGVLEFDEAPVWERWIRFSMLNGQGLCRRCHGAKSAEDARI